VARPRLQLLPAGQTIEHDQEFEPCSPLNRNSAYCPTVLQLRHKVFELCAQAGDLLVDGGPLLWTEFRCQKEVQLKANLV
jgi:hypothetical protein